MQMIQKGITLRGLEVFEAIARTGTVARASEITGLSPAAVSQHLKQLETALGQDLMDRSHRPLQPTAAGRQFLAARKRRCARCGKPRPKPAHRSWAT